MSFKYIDLFAGIGGFHAALSSLGGECVYVSEIDKAAAKIYQKNWQMKVDGDITLVANDDGVKIPQHDVLVGGFPCQPFSKSGHQRGMEEARGTLFWNIAKIIEKRRPALVVLENVRNIAGPRHIHEWEVIISTLRQLGYQVSSKPLIVSPHKIHPNYGGRPQVRERVLIAATRIPKGGKPNSLVEPPNLEHLYEGWDPLRWNLQTDLPLEQKLSSEFLKESMLSETELEWLEAWNEFVILMKKEMQGRNLPGFPIWVDAWVESKSLKIPRGTPDWKRDFLIKNSNFYSEHKKTLDAWLKRWNGLKDFPPSRRKFEWQAQDAKDLYSTVMHFRPSGIRAKKPTYLPALVAITQTSILGNLRRRIVPIEAQRLQGFPDWFSFEGQSTAATFKQLGNAVNVAVVYHVMKALVERDEDLLKSYPELVNTILQAPQTPDVVLMKLPQEVRENLNRRKRVRQLSLPVLLDD